MIHLLPGMNEMSFEVMKQQINVLTAMHGIAATVGSARVYLNTVAHYLLFIFSEITFYKLLLNISHL